MPARALCVVSRCELGLDFCRSCRFLACHGVCCRWRFVFPHCKLPLPARPINHNALLLLLPPAPSSSHDTHSLPNQSLGTLGTPTRARHRNAPTQLDSHTPPHGPTQPGVSEHHATTYTAEVRQCTEAHTVSSASSLTVAPVPCSFDCSSNSQAGVRQCTKAHTVSTASSLTVAPVPCSFD